MKKNPPSFNYDDLDGRTRAIHHLLNKPKSFNARQPDKKILINDSKNKDKDVLLHHTKMNRSQKYIDYPGNGKNRLIDMSMEQVAHNGLEDLNLETLIDWMKETDVSYVEVKRLG